MTERDCPTNTKLFEIVPRLFTAYPQFAGVFHQAQHHAQRIADGRTRWIQRRGVGASQRRDARVPGASSVLERHAIRRDGSCDSAAGNPTAGSVILVAEAGAEKSAYSVNHGAGRCIGRKAADRALDQKTVDDEFVSDDILTNCRMYPKDEAPAAYKDFDAVLDSVKAAGLASEVARLKARFVIKDDDASLRGAA